MVGTTTCTRKGYGYDDGSFKHGAWTETFLVEGILPGLRNQGAEMDVLTLFRDCRERYVRSHSQRGDRPCFFARLGPGSESINTEEDASEGLLTNRHISVKDLFQ